MTISSKSAILAAALLLGTTTAAPGRSQSGATDLTGIEWTVSAPSSPGGSPHLQIRHGSSSNSSFTLDPAEPGLVEVSTALGSRGERDVTFTIDREPGVLTCRGTVEGPYDGRGDCVFAPDAAFHAGLDARGLAPKRRGDPLAMALVSVDLALIDGLTVQGLPPRSADEVIGAAALDVTPSYVADLKSAGLVLRSLDDAIACRALGIDDAYVRGIAAAGYQPSARDLMAMKAIGVTPEYAQKINAAAQN